MVFICTRTDELCHHGIQGQKWGKRNGPPYPLDYESHSSAEKKKNPKSKISGDNQNDSSKEHKGLTSRQKKLIVAGTAFVATAAISGIAIHELKKYGHSNISNNILIGGLYNKKVPKNNKYIINNALKMANSNWDGKNPNCAASCLAFEGNMRGEHWSAKSLKVGMTISKMGEYLNGLNSNDVIGHSLNLKDNRMPINHKELSLRGIKVEEELKRSIQSSYPEDARGCAFVPSKFGSHWISWIKTSSGVELLNPQDPNKSLINFLGGYIERPNDIMSQLTTFRLDKSSFTSSISDIITNFDLPNVETDYNPYIISGQNFVIDLLKSK